MPKNKLGQQPAFPVKTNTYGNSMVESIGITERMYIATAIMQGLATNVQHYGGKEISKGNELHPPILTFDQTQEESIKHYVSLSFKIADEMLNQQ